MALLQRALQRHLIANRSCQTRLFSIVTDEHRKYEKPSPYWHYDEETKQYQRPIFVAATRQHVGKTTSSLAIVSGLSKRFNKVGFIKPVGQQHVDVKNEAGETVRVDKDVCLVKEHFHLNHLDYSFMSPVIIPRGYTKKYIDGEISDDVQMKHLLTAMSHVTDVSDVTICEGTGHCAVGSIVGMNNAKVASLIGADMVLIANGGLGSAFDELELNRVLCHHYNVRVAGVIINKVMPAKLEQTKEYLGKALKNAWGIPLLGCIPDRPFLGCPALSDFESLFETRLVSGSDSRFRHYNVGDITVVTTSLTRFLENLRLKPSRTLYICHVTRDDLILGFMGEYQRRKAKGESFEAALIICGRKQKYELSDEIQDMMKGAEGAPMMVVGLSTHDAMTKISNYTPKLNIDDTNRVSVAVKHYEQYIDFDELLKRTRTSTE
jgi:BioD-like phosphotransacetylase family protein